MGNKKELKIGKARNTFTSPPDRLRGSSTWSEWSSKLGQSLEGSSDTVQVSENVFDGSPMLLFANIRMIVYT